MAEYAAHDIDFAEVHDAFTPFEIITTEDLGFFPAGKGGDAALDGKTAIDGTLPINPSGGLKARGHPVGASGLAQVVEVIKRLRGEVPLETPPQTRPDPKHRRSRRRITLSPSWNAPTRPAVRNGRCGADRRWPSNPRAKQLAAGVSRRRRHRNVYDPLRDPGRISAAAGARADPRPRWRLAHGSGRGRTPNSKSARRSFSDGSTASTCLR